MRFVPRHVVQTAPNARPERWAWLLHGILGSGQNLRTVARRLSAAAPEWGFILPDLRNHGESHGAPPPHTVAACADDLDALADALGIHPKTAIGHSFGGKVALVWGARTEARGGEVDRVWALDVPPGAPVVPIELHSEVVQVVRALRAIPVPLARRDDVIALLTGLRFSAGLAQWMTTNLRASDAGYVWRFDLDGIEAMLLDYATVDTWAWLTAPARRARVDIVKAARSDRWADAELARFSAHPAGLHLHELPDAGHWLHVDNPDGLHALLLAEGLGD